jgi:hypothetical protein
MSSWYFQRYFTLRRLLATRIASKTFAMGFVAKLVLGFNVLMRLPARCRAWKTSSTVAHVSIQHVQYDQRIFSAVWNKKS